MQQYRRFVLLLIVLVVASCGNGSNDSTNGGNVPPGDAGDATMNDAGGGGDGGNSEAEAGSSLAITVSDDLNADFEEGSAEFIIRSSGDYEQTSFTLMMQNDGGAHMSLFIAMRGAPAPAASYEAVSTITDPGEASVLASPVSGFDGAGELVDVGQAEAVSGTLVVEESSETLMRVRLEGVVLEEDFEEGEPTVFTLDGTFTAIHP